VLLRLGKVLKASQEAAFQSPGTSELGLEGSKIDMAESGGSKKQKGERCPCWWVRQFDHSTGLEGRWGCSNRGQI
jgi:hypothetical protein